MLVFFQQNFGKKILDPLAFMLISLVFGKDTDNISSFRFWLNKLGKKYII